MCRSHQKRVFETVKNINQTVRQRSLTPTSANIPGSNQTLSARTSPQSSGLSTPHSSMYAVDIIDNRAQSILMETASNQDRWGVNYRGNLHESKCEEASNVLVSGADCVTLSCLVSCLCSSSSMEGQEKKASGAEDLRLALRRLSLRRQNNLSERRFFEEERDRRRGGHGGVHDSLGQESVMTPSESLMSLGNLHIWASRGPYLPDKLQIVKPLEGEGDR